MRKDCLGFHQIETITLMPCLSIFSFKTKRGDFFEFFFVVK